MFMKRLVSSCFVLVCALGCVDAAADNESIQVSPAQPTAADAIRLDLQFLIRSNCFIPGRTQATVSGNRIDLVTNLSPTVNVVACSGLPWAWGQQVDLSPLPEGRYQLVWHYTGDSAEEYLPFSRFLDVGPAPEGSNGASVALPAISTFGLIALAAMLALAAMSVHRVREKR